MKLENNLLTLQPFVINLGALTRGSGKLSGVARKEFFESFGNQDILDSDVRVEADIFSHGQSVDVKASLKGTVTVRCDRCWDELILQVDCFFDEHYVPEENELDISQDVYDYICTSLPLRRVHEDGNCNKEATKYLNEEI